MPLHAETPSPNEDQIRNREQRLRGFMMRSRCTPTTADSLMPWRFPALPRCRPLNRPRAGYRADQGRRGYERASEVDSAADPVLLRRPPVADDPRWSAPFPPIGGAGGAGWSSRPTARPAHHVDGPLTRCCRCLSARRHGRVSGRCRGRVFRAGRRDRVTGQPKGSSSRGIVCANRCGGGR